MLSLMCLWSALSPVPGEPRLVPFMPFIPSQAGTPQSKAGLPLEAVCLLWARPPFSPPQ